MNDGLSIYPRSMSYVWKTRRKSYIWHQRKNLVIILPYLDCFEVGDGSFTDILFRYTDTS